MVSEDDCLFIENFLSDRFFRVRVGNAFSDLHEQELGVPQGSILLVTLFSIEINNIAKVIGQMMHCSLYVDDICICYRGKCMHSIEQKIQMTINKMQSITNSTLCIHFCQLRSLHLDPELFLDGETKFLGITFDNKLTFIPHLKKLKGNCFNVMNILKVLAKTKWGVESSVLLNLYRVLIQSCLDHG